LHHTQITGILESRGVSMGEGSDGKRALSRMWYLLYDANNDDAMTKAADKVGVVGIGGLSCNVVLAV